MADPKGFRPQVGDSFDNWAPDGGKGTLLEWNWVREQMYSARNYWVLTSPKTGPPHPTPVWGLFIDDVLYFCTTTSSLKAKHIARTGEATIHLESGDMVVILKGEANTEADPELVEKLGKKFLHKYKVEVVDQFPDQVMISFRTHKAIAWQAFPESEFMRTMTSFDLT
ncbi:MAG: pyridoxamine 5'-phosphate oxidase family protein [Myxococcales bacterium]|nr:pyridoxamine 5'-phosphate oxidase family protein [Myxococcales bacterium]